VRQGGFSAVNAAEAAFTPAFLDADPDADVVYDPSERFSIAARR
jgi:hypothetical protein